MKQIGLVTLILLSLISCNEGKGKENVTKEVLIDNEVIKNNEIEKGNPFFEIFIDIVVLEDDKFHVFYKDFNNNSYSADRVLESVIRGSDSVQTIKFLIPEDIIFNGLRLDFGMNYGQKPMKLHSVKIRFDKSEFIFDKDKFAQLFKPNKYVHYDELEQLIITNPIDGKYDPNFVSINIEDIAFQLIDN